MIHARTRCLLLLAGSLALLLVPARGAEAAKTPGATVIATVQVGALPWGVAVDPKTDRVFVSDTNSNTVSVLDGDTGAVIATIPVANGPKWLAVGKGGLVYVSGDPISVIDARALTVASTIPNPCGAGALAVDDRAGRLYAANLSGTVCVIDVGTGSLLAQPTYGYFSPSIALNPRTRTLYVADLIASFLWVVDAQSLAVEATLGPLPPQEDGVFGLGVNAKTNTAYATNEDGSYVAVVDGATNTVVTTIPIGPVAETVAVDERTDTAYIPSWDRLLYAVDGATNTVAYTVPIGSEAIGTAVDPKTRRVYVANSGDGTVSVIQTTK